MKKLLKRTLLTLCAAFCLGLLSFSVQAATVSSGSCGDNLRWVLDDRGTLTISGSGVMYDWGEYYEVPWYSGVKDIQTVVIKDQVTSIGKNAFRNCSNLKNVTIGDGVTSIGEHAFFWCTSLGEMTIGDNVQDIGGWAFYYCPALEEVTMGSGVETIGTRAFYGCSGLTELTLGSNVKTVEDYAFAACDGLKNIYIPESVRYFGESVFSDCTGLTGVHISNLDAWFRIDFTLHATNPLCYAGTLYLNGTPVTEVYIPDHVIALDDYVFSGCTSIQKVHISENVESIGNYAFGGCTGLATVNIPDSVETIGHYAFIDCSSLREVTIGSGVKSIACGAFDGCTSLKNVFFTGSAPDIYEYTTFSGVTATVYYPFGDASWTEAVRKNYDGQLTWISYVQPEKEKFQIDVSRMILGNSLEFQFGVAKSKIEDPAGYYAVVEKTGENGATINTIPAEKWGSAGQYWAIIYDTLAAKEMADVFRVTIYNRWGEPVSEPKTDSVRDYVARAFDSQTDAGRTMMVDLLNYGAAAQKRFNYNTQDLASSNLTPWQRAYGSTVAAATRNQQVTGPSYMGTRLVLESRIQMQVAFAGLTRSMYAVYYYTDHYGQIRTVRVDGKDFITAGTLLGIELSELVYADARTLVTVKVYETDGTLFSGVKESMESYVDRSGVSDPLFDALMKFADSAKAYLHQ